MCLFFDLWKLSYNFFSLFQWKNGSFLNKLMEWKIISVQNSYISKKSEPKSKCNTISRSWTHFHNIRILNFGQSMNLMRHFYSKRDYNITHKQLIKYTVSIVVFDEMVLLQNLSKHENNERIFFFVRQGCTIEWCFCVSLSKSSVTTCFQTISTMCFPSIFRLELLLKIYIENMKTSKHMHTSTN